MYTYIYILLIYIYVYIYVYIYMYIYIYINTLRKIGPWINVKNRWLLSCFRTFSERVQRFFCQEFRTKIGHDWAWLGHLYFYLKAGYTLQIAMSMRKWWWITEWAWEMLKTPSPRCSDAKPLRNRQSVPKNDVPRQHTWALAPLALHPASWALGINTGLNMTQPSILGKL